MAGSSRVKADPTKLVPEVAATIRALPGLVVDRAAVRLAERYAATIDAASDDPETYQATLAKLGPLLLAALSALGATPAARSGLVKGGTPNVGPASALDRIRAARAGRTG